MDILQHPVISVKTVLRSNEEVPLGDMPHHVFIYQQYKDNRTYRAFCAGNIITDTRVLTSSHCFYTNNKRRRRNFNKVKVVAGILYTLVDTASIDDNQQWRSVSRIYTQRFFRFPAFNLAVLEIQIPWIFNKYVKNIPYTQRNQDFDGVCSATAVKATKSWSFNKSLVTKNMRLVTTPRCEKKLRRNCFYFYCTVFDTKRAVTTFETEGGGLICHGTGDPAEAESGVLVGVTSLISYSLPTLYNRIGVFHKWVVDGCAVVTPGNLLKYSHVIAYVVFLCGLM